MCLFVVPAKTRLYGITAAGMNPIGRRGGVGFRTSIIRSLDCRIG
jgi:hypothetical protein